MHVSNAALLQLLYLVQTPACMYAGYLTARKTGRNTLDWVILGFLAAIIPGGFLLVLGAYFFCRPAPSGKTGAIPPPDRG